MKKNIAETADYEILAKGPPNNEPTYSDIHYLASSQLLLVDRYNKMCCLTDTKYMPTKSLKLKKMPTRATSLANGKLALTTDNEKTIHILSENLQTEDELTTKFIPKAICGLKNDRIAVSWLEPVAFGIIVLQDNNKAKHEVKDIAYFDRDKAQRRFKSFDYVAVDERRGQVVQPCTVDKAVYGFDFDGIPRFKYTHGALVSPSGVACDRDGYIYVCETQQSSIHIISPDGAGIHIIKEGLLKPLALSVNSNNNELAVTRNCSVWHKVTVFKLSMIKINTLILSYPEVCYSCRKVIL